MLFSDATAPGRRRRANRVSRTRRPGFIGFSNFDPQGESLAVEKSPKPSSPNSKPRPESSYAVAGTKGSQRVSWLIHTVPARSEQAPARCCRREQAFPDQCRQPLSSAEYHEGGRPHRGRLLKTLRLS